MEFLMMLQLFKEVKTMIDKIVRKFRHGRKNFKTEEQITERILWRNAKSLLGGQQILI